MATCPKCRAHYADDVASCEVDGEALLPDEACASFDGDLEKGDFVGEYQIDRKIGQGAFGTVYGAFHPVIGKAAAIKVLHRKYSADPLVVSRFVAEARAVNQIRHRHIIDVFSFGTLDDGQQYFVMEWLDGVTLQDYLDEHLSLSPAQAVGILRDIGRALDAAHGTGIAHRDLKPENVFLCFDEEGTCFPKLLDFGIAKLLGDVAPQHKTGTGVALGTPFYMSPEQCVGKHVDQRTDIYSFGAMTHEILTGHPPFDADGALEILMKHMVDDPMPVSRCADVPEALDAPVLHMLAKDPADRPQTLREAVEELTEAARQAGLEVGGPESALEPPAESNRIKPSPAPVPSGAELAATHHAEGDLAVDAKKRGPAAPGSPGATAQGIETEVALAGSGRTRLLVVGGAALVGGVVLATMIFGSDGERDDPSVPSATAPDRSELASSAPPSSAPDPSGSAASTVSEVELTIVSKTKDIRVRMGKQKLGSSAGEMFVPRGSQPVELTLEKDGFVPEVRNVTPERDIELEITMRRAGPTTPSRPSSTVDTSEIYYPPGYDDL